MKSSASRVSSRRRGLTAVPVGGGALVVGVMTAIVFSFAGNCVVAVVGRPMAGRPAASA